MRWMIPVFMFTLLLSGCMTEVKESLPEEPVKTAQTTPQLTTTEYIQMITTHTEDMQVEFTLLEDLSNDPSIEGYTEKTIEQAKKVIDVAQRYELLNPPAELEQAHQTIVASMKHYQEAMVLLIKGMEEQDVDLLLGTEDLMNEARVQFNSAYENESFRKAHEDYVALSEGMKSMDSAVGIDRESVQQNLSEDGHELVGKWGYMQDGTFQLLFLLNEDGSYKRYKEYPDESSIIIGRWEYKQEDNSFTFYNDEAYDNGVNIMEQTRSQLINDVQYFDGKELQIMDAETFSTVRYLRGE